MRSALSMLVILLQSLHYIMNPPIDKYGLDMEEGCISKWGRVSGYLWRVKLGSAARYSGQPQVRDAPPWAGQSHLNSDATIAHEGRPQGAPLPIVFSRRLALGRAPTRGAPTDCLLSAFGPGKGTHKGCPYRLSSLGVWPWEGHPQGVPLPIVFSRRFALRRAPTRGTPTDCQFL